MNRTFSDLIKGIDISKVFETRFKNKSVDEKLTEIMRNLMILHLTKRSRIPAEFLVDGVKIYGIYNTKVLEYFIRENQDPNNFSDNGGAYISAIAENKGLPFLLFGDTKITYTSIFNQTIHDKSEVTFH